MRTRKAAIYIRVEQEMPIFADNQKTILLELAKGERIEVKEIFQDIGFKNSYPALQQMMETAKAGAVDAVIIMSLSRLGRNMEQTEKLIEELQLSGVELLTWDKSFDAAYYFPFTTWIKKHAEAEQKQMSERT